jgi:Derlin-2/3
MTTAAFYLELYDPYNIALDYGLVFKRFQVKKLVANLSNL